MKKVIFFFCFICGIVCCHAQQTVKGVVFEDSNHNSVFDGNEAGIAGVGVSNGIEVVLTDRNGYYELPATDHMVVFVIKPSGYQFPVNEMQLSQFYYIHKPKGSPESTYPGSKPTGKLPESVDFPLIKYEEKEDFNILVFGDTQPYSEREIDFLKRSIVENLVGISDIAFGTTLGDITGDRPDFFGPVSEVISRIGVPWYHVMGNHDQNYEAKDDRTASESYEAFYGPSTYSFNYGKVHFIIADDIIHYLDENGKANYTGGFREDQLRFIENDLKHVPTDHLVMLVVHIPLSDEGGNETFRHADRDRVFAALSRFSNSLSVSAHTHYIKQHYFGQSEGWKGSKPHQHLNLGAVCGDWWKGIIDQYELPGTMMRDGSPQGYFILKFTGNQYIYDYHVVHYDAPKQISLYKKENVLYANFFTGNEFSQLKYRINSGEWSSMQMTIENDPLFSSIRERWEQEKTLPGKVPSKPSLSEHLWKAEIKVSGKCSVEVMATDNLGRIFTQKMIID